MYLGDPYPNWQAKNSKKNRFHLLNIGQVANSLDLNPTNSQITQPYFDEAGKIIERETLWVQQYGAKTKLNASHIYDGRGDGRFGAKKFGQALTIIVAMEVASRRLRRPDVNVYNIIRIIPAFYFVDRLDKAKLAAIEVHYRSLSEEDRITLFGASGRHASFAEVCLSEISHSGIESSGIIDQLCLGCTATKDICERITSLINEKLPEKLHVGPVRTAGDEKAHSAKLGTQRSVRGLKVPRYAQFT